MVYHHDGRSKDAEQLYRRALSILEKALGLNHPDVAVVLENMAEFYTDLGDYYEAGRLRKRSDDIRSGNR